MRRVKPANLPCLNKAPVYNQSPQVVQLIIGFLYILVERGYGRERNHGAKGGGMIGEEHNKQRRGIENGKVVFVMRLLSTPYS